MVVEVGEVVGMMNDSCETHSMASNVVQSVERVRRSDWTQLRVGVS